MEILYGWKAIQKYLKLSKATIKKRGYPVMVRDRASPRVCADTEMLDEHAERLFRQAVPYTPKRTRGESGKGA